MRSSIRDLAVLVSLVCFAGSPIAVVGQPDSIPRLPESAIYPVKKKKPGNDSQSPSQAPRPPATDRAPTNSGRAAPRTTKPREAPQRPVAGAPQQQSFPGTRTDQPATAAQLPTERVLNRKLGPEKVREILDRIGPGGAHPGKGSSNGDSQFDVATPGTGVDDVVVPNGGYKRGTTQDGQETVRIYKSIPPGVTLEGVPAGLGEIRSVRYDRRFNAFILDDRAAYFMKIPPKSVAVLCRAIDQDEQELVGVGITTKKHLIYGKMPADSDIAWDLMLADNFFGDIVFAQNTWSVGYRFVAGFKPEPNQGEILDTAVFFNFNGFEFEIQAEEVRLTKARFDVKLFPLSRETTPEGGVLPDYRAIEQGRISRQYEANARHLAENISYFRRERIVNRAFAYGETAAFIRALKRAGFDLEDLAAHIPSDEP
jgi:hypothetical protein